MSLMTCPRCASPVFDCVCPERHLAKLRTPESTPEPPRTGDVDVGVPVVFEGDDDPPRLALGDPAYRAVVLFAEDLTVDAAWLDAAEVRVRARVRTTIAAGKGGR